MAKASASTQASTPTTDATAPAVAVSTPSAPLDQATFLSALDAVIGKLGVQQANGLTADQLQTILSSNASAVQKAMKPENATAPNVSAFNPTGDAKVPLKRKTYFVGAKMTDDILTPLEIELFNRFDTSRTARNGKWTARIRENGDTQELHVNVPHKEIDDRMNLPVLTLILRELLDGAEAANPESLASMVERQQQEIEALKRQMAVA
jgi:hypothetical protein